MSSDTKEFNSEKEIIDSPIQIAEPTIVPSAEDVKRAIRERTFGESINFNSLYRVKGRRFLWMPLMGKAMKNGMIGMIELGVDNPISVHKDDCECLADFVFYKTDGSKIRMAQVFDNLEKVSLEELKGKNDLELMQIMCPDYNPDLFKPYHGEKVISWYFEIKEKIAINIPQ